MRQPCRPSLLAVEAEALYAALNRRMRLYYAWRVSATRAGDEAGAEKWQAKMARLNRVMDRALARAWRREDAARAK